MLRILRRKIMTSTININDFNIVKEGRAEILTPKEDKVFYNHIQQFNRDLSVMAINAYANAREEEHARKEQKSLEAQKVREEKKETNETGEEEQQQKPAFKKRKLGGISILEALSATGLRAIRYGHEIPHASKIVANDLLPEAVKSITRNIEYNKLTDKVTANHGDAIKFMASTDEKFHVVDLDPYGTATPFLDGAIQCLADDGLLLVTCTDAGVLAGSGYPEKCFALYGGNNFGNSYVNSEANHEAGIRLMLNMIANTAAKYGKSIEPLLSLSIDYYFRLFIKVKRSPMQVKNHASETMLTYGCNGCGNKIFQPLGQRKHNKYQYPKLAPGLTSSCEYCESSFNIAGPMYGSAIHNHEFIDKVLKINSEAEQGVYGTSERIKGMLSLAKNELDFPFYFNLSHFPSIFKSAPISIDQFAKAIGALGYKLSLTHTKRNCVKTNAPWDVVLKINREWAVASNKKYLEEMKAKEDISDKIKEKLEQLEKDITYNPKLAKDSVGDKIMTSLKGTEELKIDFETENDQSKHIAKLRQLKMVRFQENPKNWGPKARPSSK
ncbi:TRM1 [[Candida] subhashii]|uniref:tRNA (guanine(26)-N(2))-dimethyltransferase n=1 Tax=[Candida] subhashii TaxID=561895 RepID=A0A8J5QHQ5_9ASCO|nr:TRM1 [[Candida] subhashii]KAG7662244.1 TRM1 [[Candida] subhashii]